MAAVVEKSFPVEPSEILVPVTSAADLTETATIEMKCLSSPPIGDIKKYICHKIKKSTFLINII